MITQKKILQIISVIILLGIGGTQITYAQTLIYKKTRSGKEFYEEFDITKSRNKYIVKVSNSLNKKTDTYDTDPAFSILKWRSQWPEKGTDITAERKGNRIFITGKFNNENYEKEFKINDLPWYQEWELELQAFINSDKDSTRFWSIDPNKLRIAKFEAKKEKIEVVDINGQKTKSVHVKLSLAGWMKVFWGGGEMWFRDSDGMCLFFNLDPERPEDNAQLIKEE